MSIIPENRSLKRFQLNETCAEYIAESITFLSVLLGFILTICFEARSTC